MKKFCLIFVILLIFLTGCNNSDTPEIDEYTWQMTTVQSVKNRGESIAYGLGNVDNSHSGIKLELEFRAENNALKLSDKTNNKTYSGSYKLLNTTAESLNYGIVIDGTKGMAVVAMTTYHDSSQTPTLIISVGNYVLNFMNKK